MAEPEASYLARHGVESTITAAVSQVLKEKPLDPLKRIGQLLLGALPGSALQVELSDAAHDLIHANGWRLGMVGFGSPASESTVRVMSAMCIAASHQNSLPDEFSWVELTYDDQPLSERGGTYIKKKAHDHVMSHPHSSHHVRQYASCRAWWYIKLTTTLCHTPIRTISLLQSVVVHTLTTTFMSHPHSSHTSPRSIFWFLLSLQLFLVSSLSPTQSSQCSSQMSHTLPFFLSISGSPFLYIYISGSPVFSPRGKLTMGVRSAEWAELSGGAAEMPAILIDGIMYRDSIPIVRMLATACPDETLDRSSQARSHLPRSGPF